MYRLRTNYIWYSLKYDSNSNAICCRALVFEEEDFQPMVYGYRLIPDVSEPRTVGMLKEVEEELHRRTRSKLSDSCSSDEVNSCFLIE